MSVCPLLFFQLGARYSTFLSAEIDTDISYTVNFYNIRSADPAVAMWSKDTVLFSYRWYVLALRECMFP